MNHHLHSLVDIASYFRESADAAARQAAKSRKSEAFGIPGNACCLEAERLAFSHAAGFVWQYAADLAKADPGLVAHAKGFVIHRAGDACLQCNRRVE